jgi:hypothetical protein
MDKQVEIDQRTFWHVLFYVYCVFTVCGFVLSWYDPGWCWLSVVCFGAVIYTRVRFNHFKNQE